MTTNRLRVFIWSTLAAFTLLLGIGTATAVAQDATPAAMTESAHPVHIHSGTCATLGEVVYPLNDITTYQVTNSFSFGPAATPEMGSMASPLPAISITSTQETPFLFSATHIDAAPADLATGDFAINAHESMENIQNYIACGDIPACVPALCSAVTAISVQLAPLNNSGYFGVARIEADPNGGSNVVIYLFHVSLPMAS